ncbi:hypothetical protein LWI28_017043 [Acer negundo]|uniref:Uncharacterized protein n=1 Tax=Acer negundo TaxID=4023 RepID=A0AAD5J6Q0_ACENE|nr:hypothetical protein LWI28_017043 [Acer negundo]
MLRITDQGLGTHLKHWLMHLYSWTRSRMVVSAKPDMGPAVLEYPVLSEFIGTASNVAACKITGQAFSKQGSNLDETSGDRIPVLYEERNNDNNRKPGSASHLMAHDDIRGNNSPDEDQRMRAIVTRGFTAAINDIRPLLDGISKILKRLEWLLPNGNRVADQRLQPGGGQMRWLVARRY